MNQLNSILIEGNLAKDPLLQEASRDGPVCYFTIASNRFFKVGAETESEVSYFDVETWSKLADSCGKNLKKGRGVRVIGRLKQIRWVDADGTHRSAIKIMAEHVEFKPELKSESESEPEPEPVDNVF